MTERIDCRRKRGLGRVTKRVASVSATAALVLGGFMATASEAQAVVCRTGTYWTSTNAANSDTFVKPPASQTGCLDLNAANNTGYVDYDRGWYYSNGSWKTGSAGWVKVPHGDLGWKVLLSSVLPGTTMRGQVYAYMQYVKYVF